MVWPLGVRRARKWRSSRLRTRSVPKRPASTTIDASASPMRRSRNVSITATAEATSSPRNGTRSYAPTATSARNASSSPTPASRAKKSSSSARTNGESRNGGPASSRCRLRRLVRTLIPNECGKQPARIEQDQSRPKPSTRISSTRSARSASPMLSNRGSVGRGRALVSVKLSIAVRISSASETLLSRAARSEGRSLRRIREIDGGLAHVWHVTIYDRFRLESVGATDESAGALGRAPARG